MDAGEEERWNSDKAVKSATWLPGWLGDWGLKKLLVIKRNNPGLMARVIED
jgi:hypothetical protein